MNIIKKESHNPLRLGALISGGGTNLQAIIDACDSGKIDGRLVFVGTDTPGAKGLKRAIKHGIPTFIVDYSSILSKAGESKYPLPDDFDCDEILKKQKIIAKVHDHTRAGQLLESRVRAEAALLSRMADYDFDLIVLAGFMRNLTPYFIDRINKDPEKPRIMNIHPALLPAFPGVDGYGDTFRYGCRVGGCTVHFIDYGEDSGPIIGQKAFSITSDDTIESVKSKGLELEWELYPECIRLFSEGRLKVEQRLQNPEKDEKHERNVVRIL